MTEGKQTRDIRALIEQGIVPPPERLLGAEDKERLAEAGTELTVTSVSVGDDKQFGPYWQIQAELPDGPVSFRLSLHARRDSFMSSIASMIEEGPVSGLRLRAYPGQGGNAFVTLEPA